MRVFETIVFPGIHDIEVLLAFEDKLKGMRVKARYIGKQVKIYGRLYNAGSTIVLSDYNTEDDSIDGEEPPRSTEKIIIRDIEGMLDIRKFEYKTFCGYKTRNLEAKISIQAGTREIHGLIVGEFWGAEGWWIKRKWSLTGVDWLGTEDMNLVQIVENPNA